MTIAKRRLTDIKFEHDGAHVALVGKHQGGPANGITTLITKATNQITQDQIAKATTVNVEMQFPEFLRKFFGLYWDDAEVLSAVMGYGRTEYPDASEKDYIDSRVESISIMKAVYKAQDVEKALAALTPEQHLALMADQEMLEKAFADLPEQPTKQEETQMETILKAAHEEAVTAAVAVEKAAGAVALAEIVKAMGAQEEVLKAAQAQVEAFVAAEAARVQEVRKSALAAVLPSEQVESVLKALEAVADEAFQAVVAGYAVQKAAVDNSDMMSETGVAGAGEVDTQVRDLTAEILKAKYAPKAAK
jgi:Mor family transcriptional regulator